jgi:hypothetical protein
MSLLLKHDKRERHFGEEKRTWVVEPSYFARTVESETWGMMFFSTESWKSGGRGRSRARKRKGD